MRGKINSFQSMGAVDGPGIRYVIFMQGCALRCGYCHNPDTWKLDGEEYCVDEVFERIMRCKLYFGKEGGVTISGGEPLLQWEFVSQLLSRLQREGVHTALDTSGIGDLNGAREVLKYTNLVLCDLKFSTDQEYFKYTNGSLEEVTSFLALTEQMQIPLWIRHVVVLDLTDSKERVLEIAKMARQFSNLSKFELLPFKKLCVSKYEALGIPFPFINYNECSDTRIKELYDEIIEVL